jgi:peptide/nickel transport system substrate-binding protein
VNWLAFLLLFLASAVHAQDKLNVKELSIGTNTEYETLNPLINSTGIAKYILYLSNRIWTYLDDNNEWKAGIVKKIPNLKDGSLKIITENGVKKMTAEWEFLDNLKWGDATPVTCKDAKFTWEVGTNPNVSMPSRDGYENIESIEWTKEKPSVCLVKYKTAKWNFFYDSHSFLLPAHIEEPIFKKWKDQKQGYDQNSLYQKDPTNKGLWNGPYLVSEVKLGSHIIFVPNPHFYGKKPNISKVIVRVIPGTGVLEANLRSGTISKIARIGMTLDQGLAFAKKIKTENLPFKAEFSEGITYVHIDINLDHPILSDVKVRQAMSHAVNKNEINTAIFEGQVKSASSMISPIDPLYNDDSKVVRKYDFNKKKARKILDGLGWKMGKDGYRYKNGQQLVLNFHGATGNRQIETLQTILQQQWKEIGINVQLKSVPGRILFSETLKKRQFDIAVFAWSSFPGMGQESFLHSKNIPSESNSWTGQNYTGFRNVNVDQLVQDYDYEFDFAKRKKITDQIVKEYTTQIPVIPLYFRSEVSVIPSSMTGYKMTAHSFYETLSAEFWDL